MTTERFRRVALGDVGSTNDEARRRIDLLANEEFVVTGVRQLTGRGRVRQELTVNGQRMPSAPPLMVPLKRGPNHFLLRVRDESGQQDQAVESLDYTPPPPPPPHPLPGRWGEIQLPDVSGTALRVDGRLFHNGLSVVVREAGRELGKSNTLPFYVRGVQPGERQIEVCAVDASGRQRELLSRKVLVSDLAPLVRGLQVTPKGHDKVQVGIDAVLQGKGQVTLRVEHNGAQVPPDAVLELTPGYNLVWATARDEAGRDDQKFILLRYFPATRKSTSRILQRGETSKVEEAYAVRAYFAGDYRGALGKLHLLLNAHRGVADLYALSARTRLGIAQQLQGHQRGQQLTEAVYDAGRAVASAQRPYLYEIQAQTYDALGQGTKAEAARRQANLLR